MQKLPCCLHYASETRYVVPPRLYRESDFRLYQKWHRFANSAAEPDRSRRMLLHLESICCYPVLVGEREAQSRKLSSILSGTGTSVMQIVTSVSVSVAVAERPKYKNQVSISTHKTSFTQTRCFRLLPGMYTVGGIYSITIVKSSRPPRILLGFLSKVRTY